MKKNSKYFMAKYGKKLCTFAMMSAIMTSRFCRSFFYQPDEPEEIAAFREKAKKEL